MAKNNRKDPLDKEERSALNQLHNAQVTIEVAVTILVLTIFTINISSAFPGYGVFDLLVMLLAGLLLFVFGIAITINILATKRSAIPLMKSMKTPKVWLGVVWGSVIAAILLLMFNSPFKEGGFEDGSIVLLALVGVVFFGAIIGLLVSIHRVWKRFTKRKRPPVRFIVYGIIVVVMIGLAAFGSYTTTEVVKYNSVATTDANLELGQTEVRQAGKDGEKHTKRNLIFGAEVSTDYSDSVDEIIANGSRRYQYMYCSDGSYRYYTAEQFKDPKVGFTHQSPDGCALNGTGTQTTIADVPPAEKIVQQAPSRSIYYPTSYTTTCNPSIYGSSITCRTY